MTSVCHWDELNPCLEVLVLGSENVFVVVTITTATVIMNPFFMQAHLLSKSVVCTQAKRDFQSYILHIVEVHRGLERKDYQQLEQDQAGPSSSVIDSGLLDHSRVGAPG
jgi:hypothetical protein